MSVFLGMRYGLWDTEPKPERIARIAGFLVSEGLRRR
jgi:hypothetical protein